jgi:ABC-type oligopeptide transport system substrate-binding subunit
MTLLPSPRRLSHFRILLGLFVTAGVAAGAWRAAEVSAPGSSGVERRAQAKKKQTKKPEREEEEEEGDSKPRKAIPRVDEVDAKAKPRADRPAPVTDLGRAAQAERNEEIKQLFLELAVPCDKVLLRRARQYDKDVAPKTSYAIRPMADYAKTLAWLKKNLTFEVLDPETGASLGSFEDRSSNVEDLRYYERRAWEAVRVFLKTNRTTDPDDPRFLSRQRQLEVASQVLERVMQYHEGARTREERRGAGWAAVEKELRKHLLEVQVDRLKELGQRKQWDDAFTLTRKLAQDFTEREDQDAIAKPLAELLDQALKDETLTDKQKQDARQRFIELDRRFPNNPAIKPFRDQLRKDAQELFDQAKALIDKDPKKNHTDALALLRLAEERCADLADLRAYRLKLEGEGEQVLLVFVRSLPTRLSPALATTDNELRGVELLFESLVKLSPDSKGMFRYVPGLAEGRPRVVPLGRLLKLPRDACWSDGKELKLIDVRETIGRLTKGPSEGQAPATGRPPVWGDLLDAVAAAGDPVHFRLTLRQGYLDPLAMMTFKILPRHLGSSLSSEKFAAIPDERDRGREGPIGSGPFRLVGRRTDPAINREYIVFEANPYFGARASKRDLPRIRAIRFIALPKNADAVRELENFQNQDVQMALDLTPEEADKLRKDRNFVVPLPPQTPPNRRIYFLAVNNRKPGLSNANFRIATARAINRERLLDEFLRKPLGRKVHRALNGPYPAGSWACMPGRPGQVNKDGLDPFDPALAKVKLEVSEVKKLDLELKYPRGDDRLDKAMRALCDDLGGQLGITVNPVPRDPTDLRRDIEDTKFDLAYTHYDFPDETFWLMPLLGTSSRAGGDNYLGYNGSLLGRIQVAAGRRHFAQVRKFAHAIHRDFLDKEMPFIPLWQLDPLMAYRKDRLDVVPFDPLLVFTDVEHWRVKVKAP